ncbi:MAG: serine/threonine protein phosphatase, partial [Planctomycetaceae bacterium]
VCGHTGQVQGLPVHVPGYVCIDTRACSGQWLTCLDVQQSVFWQASEAGEIRGPLSLDAC